jgi:hypothetical protein
MPTTVAYTVTSIIRLAATGISKFPGGYAGFPVAYISCRVLVLFTACTGVFIDTSPLDRGC